MAIKNKSLEIKNPCDLCGGEMLGMSYPVYDENYNIQRDVRQCKNCQTDDLALGLSNSMR